MPINIWIAAIGMGILIVFAMASLFRALLLPTRNDGNLYPILRVLLSLSRWVRCVVYLGYCTTRHLPRGQKTVRVTFYGCSLAR
jgi:hypothetical protein